MNFQDFLNEAGKITLKRRYTENHPALEVGKSARVRNKMLEAIADGKITQEEFNNILKEYSKDTSKWIRRNSKFFNVSEDGISLSTFGKKALSAITVNEGEDLNENYEVIFSDGISQMKKFRTEAQAIDFMKKEIASNKKLRDIAVYKPGMYSTTQTELVVSFWGNGSYLDNVSKKDPKLAAKKLEEYVEEGRAFVAAAKKAKDEGKEEFEFDGKTFPVTIKENETVNESDKQLEKEAQMIMSDLLDEYDPWEITEMQPIEAEETVASYGHKGTKAKKIAEYLYNMASTGTFESKNNKNMKNIFVHESFNLFVTSLTKDVNPTTTTICEATVEMDAMDPDNKDFLKFLKKHKVKIVNKEMDGPAAGHPVITMQGSRKDLEAVLADDEFGWGDPELAEYIEEMASIVTEAVNASAYIKAGKLGYNDQFLGRQSLSKTLSLDLGLNPKHEYGGGDWLGFDHVTLYASGGKKVGNILGDALTGKYTYDELKAAAADFLGIKESVNEAKSDEVEIEIDFAGSKADLRKLSKKYNIEADEYDPGMVMLKGDKKDILAYLTSPQYDMDMSDIEDLFPELLESTVNEAFSSMKLQSILTGAGSMPKDFAKVFYGMAKLQLDKIQDVDIIEIDPDQARKEKRNNAVYLYFTTNEKPNPYAGTSSWGVKTIPANTLLGATNGSNEWLASEYANKYARTDREKTLRTAKKQDAVGFEKDDARNSWGSGISSISKVAELADRAYVLDLDILRARYSTTAKRDERTAAKKGATAFQSDKDFKKQNLDRYHTILADRAASMPVDKEVLKAIDVVTSQIKDGLATGEKGKYGDVIIGKDPKGREVKLRDASNAMQNLLDDFNRYVDYTNQANREEEAGYGSDYYSREVKNYAKSIKDRISKIEKMDYVW